MRETIIKIVKSPSSWIIIGEIIIILVLFKFGFRITYNPDLDTKWEAVGAMGQWAGVLVGLLIPIMAVYVDNKLNNSKKEIGESNSELFDEFELFKKEYRNKLEVLMKHVDDNGNFIIDGGVFDATNTQQLKDKALKFVNIAMMTNTKRVSEHLEISLEDTFDILEELLKHDGTISAGGAVAKDNIDNIIWIKKKRS